MGRVWKIVLTGGPCAGKTTALNNIMERFSSIMRVYCLPEMATLTFRSGVVIKPDQYTEDQMVRFTSQFIRWVNLVLLIQYSSIY